MYVYIYLSVCLHVYLYLCLSVCLFVCLSVCLSVNRIQIIGKPENQTITKMTHENLAMVWAPNFLRCSSADPMVIFNNTRREMLFVRQLIVGWDTSGADTIEDS